MLNDRAINRVEVNLNKAINTLHILDRFHVMAHINKAIDGVRAQEVKTPKGQGLGPVLTKSRWLLLKRRENLSSKQDDKLSELLQYNLKSIRGYLPKGGFQRFWEYASPYWAGQFLDKWTTKTLRSKIEPMKKVARMLRRHKPLLMNWFKAKGQFSSGIVGGFNNKVKLAVRKPYGFRTLKLHYFMHLAHYPRRKLPMNFSDEAKIFASFFFVIKGCIP